MKVAAEVRKRIKYLRYGKIFGYELFEDIENRKALYTALNKLVKEKKLKRYATGKYYKTKKFIEKFKSGKEIIFYTAEDNKSEWDLILEDGLIVGNVLYNDLGLTTQNAFIDDIKTPNKKSGYKEIGTNKINYIYFPIKVTKTNKKTIQFMEVCINRENILDMIDEEYDAYIKKSLENLNIKLFKKIFNAYSLKEKRKFITNIAPFSKEIADLANNQLKPYQSVSIKNFEVKK